MKNVVIQLNRKKLDQVSELAFIQHLDRKFKIVDDSEDKYTFIRFVTIDGEDLQIDLNGVNIELRSISKPDKYVGIYKIYVYAVEVVL